MVTLQHPISDWSVASISCISTNDRYFSKNSKELKLFSWGKRGGIRNREPFAKNLAGHHCKHTHICLYFQNQCRSTSIFECRLFDHCTIISTLGDNYTYCIESRIFFLRQFWCLERGSSRLAQFLHCLRLFSSSARRYDYPVCDFTWSLCIGII